MNLLESLAAPIEEMPLEIEIVKGHSLSFRRPKEGEPDSIAADSEKESKMYYAEEFEPTPQILEWLPKNQNDFVKATTLSHFLLDSPDQPTARKELCKVAKLRPVTFKIIYESWVNKVMGVELAGFVKEVNERKNS